MLAKDLSQKTIQIYKRIRARYNIVWSFPGIFFALTSPFRKLPEDVDYLFLCHDVHRHSKKNGLYYAPLIDPIIEELGEESLCLTLATPFSRYFGKNSFGDVRIHNFVVLWALVKRILLHRSLSLKSVRNDPMVDAYKLVLSRVRPKLVIGIQPSVEFCLAASQLNITTYDMQHGLISDVNYYSVGKRDKISQLGWPDFILCWDQESVDRVSRITEGNGIPRLVGNPSYHSESGAALHKSQFKNADISEAFRMEILVTLTYLDYGQFNEDECYREVGIPTQVLNLIKQSTDVFWRLRLHPVQVKFHYRRINAYLTKHFSGSKHVNWTEFSEISLGAALHGCSGHITVGSASALDAAQNSIPTLLVGCPGVSDLEKVNLYFGEYVESGVMMFVDSADVSAACLDFFPGSSSNREGQVVSESYLRGTRNFASFINLLKLQEVS